MNTEDLIIISVDDHITEPDDMFKARVPAAYADRAPKLVADAEGNEHWMFDGVGFDPASTAEMRPVAHDVHERIRDMNHNGILASMNFPSFPGFSGRGFRALAS